MKITALVTKRRITLAAVVAAAAVACGTTLAVAGAGPDASKADRAHARSTAKSTSGVTAGGVCNAGYNTETDTIVPPDDITPDNPPAATIELKKTCAGTVVATFTAEASTPAGGSFVHLDARAICIAPARQTRPCTVGQVAYAEPGHIFFQHGQSITATHTAQFVWPHLKRGRWSFTVLPGGDGNGSLGFRSLLVNAYQGG